MTKHAMLRTTRIEKENTMDIRMAKLDSQMIDWPRDTFRIPATRDTIYVESGERQIRDRQCSAQWRSSR